MKFLAHLSVTSVRFSVLAAAMLVYALAGSPSPDHPGWVEAVIGVLLVMAVGFPAFVRFLKFGPARPVWQAVGQILFLYGLIVSVCIGVMRGNETIMILRDLPPFFFLFLPLLAIDIFEKRPDFMKFFIAVFALAGWIFAVRSLGETSYFNPRLPENSRELYYFANAPSVLFAAVYPVGKTLELYLKTLSLRSAGLFLLALAFAALPLLAMAFTLQRASLGWAFLCYGIFGMVALWRSPLRVSILIPPALAVLCIFHQKLFYIFGLLSHKTEIYGVNKRGMELAAVWDTVSNSFMGVVFGMGWGGTFESPAAGGARINFTHSFLSGMLLKNGLVGVALALGYISGFFLKIYKLLGRDLVMTMALAGPLVIDAVLYASYKWLDFGLLLLLIAAL
jgi:hypothetical protein